MTIRTIGRSRSCDVVFKDRSISRKHAELREADGGLFLIIDLNSTNGVFVRKGGEWLQVEKAVLTGDQPVRLGEIVTSVDLMLDFAAPEQRSHAPPESAEAPVPQPPPEEAAAPEPWVELRTRRSRADRFGGRRLLPIVLAIGVVAAIGGGAAFYAIEIWPLRPWERRVAGADARSFVGLAQAGNGDVVAVGHDVNRAEKRARIAIVRFDGNGAQLGAWNLEGQPLALAAGAVPVPSGATLIIGNRLAPATDWKPWLLRLDASGKPAPIKLSLKGGMMMASAALVGSDGHLLVAGTEVGENGGLVPFAIKLDLSGKRIWMKRYPGGERSVRAAAAGPAGGFALAGLSKRAGAGDSDLWVAAFDAAGTRLWTRSLGGARDDGAAAIAALDDGYVVAGTTTSKGKGRADGWVVRLGADGATRWERTLGGAGPDEARAVARFGSDALVVVGSEATGGKRKRDAFVAKLGLDGRLIWKRTFGGPGDDVFNHVVAGGRATLLIAGADRTDGAARSKGWVVRLDRNGELKPR